MGKFQNGITSFKTQSISITDWTVRILLHALLNFASLFFFLTYIYKPNLPFPQALLNFQIQAGNSKTPTRGEFLKGVWY